MIEFAGFPPETTRFLAELRANNSRDWFQAHRADYEAFWLAPAMAFVAAAGERLAELAPGIQAEPRVLGSILRINRDTRFSKDPRPYKDHLDLWFWEGDRRRAVSGFFARLTPESLGVGAGCHELGPERLATFRRAAADPAGGAELAAIAADLEAAGYELAGRALKRPPAGVAADGPAARFLLHKALYVHADEPGPPERALDVCLGHWRALAPLHRWLTERVQHG